ncbi:hypothetical protein [Candidatus Laterigemmans baculatus]|uniref:hypothetical protein n=1 Tax=Candidatus Laterigemmans baculatus TaxID=2770505 RepID=UPI00193BE638|nr:hypothetical protein [Candidatus Laterigemmans baculatus]
MSGLQTLMALRAGAHSQSHTGFEALASGLAGALALTAVHQLARCCVAEAPRMDTLGERTIAKTMRALDLEPPSQPHLHQAALVGDIVSNSVYYSLVATGKPETAPVRGTLLGLAAGIGAVALPPRMGLGESPSGRTAATQAMAISWYTLGGLAAGYAYKLLAGRSE